MGTMIVYPTANGIAVMTPMDPSFSAKDLALRDVPEGKPFIIVDHEDLPNITFRDAWTADFKQADGVGLGYEKFQQDFEKRKQQAEETRMKFDLEKALESKPDSPKAKAPTPKSQAGRRKKVKTDE